MPDEPTEETRGPLELLQAQIETQAAQLKDAQDELQALRVNAVFCDAFDAAGGDASNKKDVLELIGMRVENLRVDKERGLVCDHGSQLKNVTPGEVVASFLESRPFYKKPSPVSATPAPEPKQETPPREKIADMTDEQLWADAGSWPKPAAPEPPKKLQPRSGKSASEMSKDELWEAAGDMPAPVWGGGE